MDFIGSLVASPFICIGWIIVGAIAGSLARSLTGSRDASFVSDLILGLIGAVIGGILAGFLGLGPSPTARGLELVIINLVIATIGAAVLIGLRRAFTRSSV